jgi:glycosyltransferase involved in cell wall biosynthesis
LGLISVITINYNNAVGLQKTISNVLSQSFRDFEFIVIDGGSDDGSVDILRQCPAITHWVTEKDNGIYDAQNKGIGQASGDYLLFLNSGDVLADATVLEKVKDNLTSGKAFYYGNLILSIADRKEKHIAPKEIDLDFLLNSTFWHPCVFIKADLFIKFGLYNPLFKIAGDYEFFIRCLLKPGILTEHIDEFICLFDGSGISNNPLQVAIQSEEREKAWKLNVSEIVYDSLKKYNSFSRSKYSSLVNTFQKLRGHRTF